MSWLRKIGFFSAFIIPTLTIVGFYFGGIANLSALIFVYALIPSIDAAVGRDYNNIPKEAVKSVSNDFYYRFITYCWTYFQLAFLLWAVWVVSTNQLTVFEAITFTIAVSLSTGGIGITVAHELGHKKSKLEKFYSKVLLMSVSYMHFYIEHNKGHHLRVSTHEDPATSRENESFYAFWWRSVSQGYLSAWEIENKRLERKNKPKFSIHNQMIWFTLLPFIFAFSLTLGVSIIIGAFTWIPFAFFFAQSFLAFSLLEAVNYVEHYGLRRKKLDDQRYERVAPHHSWNANHMVSNFFLFQLQRHSDHHFNAIKRYQVLDNYESAPQLPAGYPTMILLAHFPPLWFKVMNPKLQKWNNLKSTTS
ncbi:alkane 1-monooxygenase [Marivirga harenae]|uniref:alkane 1-monooxygenase n=1 Tax=Marivirga harenae TaxID=2010992 RepID=UPI0026E1077E|nr:alkane 1-monooxygenase [Marivirga harenae]WKV11772.1 alkane 1-monooxygenase [Marivirga harenae]|tara:strand:+ start:10956 stop:12041 length:1086 start_codon:yes stop_codon:yes gene_type:complete